MAIPRAGTHYEKLVERDGEGCWYCRRSFTKDRPPTLDHRVPRARGGGGELANLVLACGPCNEDKADRMPDLPTVIPSEPGRRRLLALARMGGRTCGFCGGGLGVGDDDERAGGWKSAPGTHPGQPAVDRRAQWGGLVALDVDGEVDGGGWVLLCRTCKGWRYERPARLEALRVAAGAITEQLEQLVDASTS